MSSLLLHLAEKKSLHWSAAAAVSAGLEEEEGAEEEAPTGRPLEGGGGSRPPVEDSPVCWGEFVKPKPSNTDREQNTEVGGK